MNIKITHNWLLEYLDTDATPNEIREYLSLCGPSIESVTKVNGDYVYDIEVISNRIDYTSVIGIAREVAAILPMFGKKAKFKGFSAKLTSGHPRGVESVESVETELKIIDNDNLCPRKLAVVMEVKVGQSPKYIRERLENCGIRSLNNLIDITNYVMLETGHPAHVFDFDRVKTGKIFIRKAKNGEKITTLDGKTYILNSQDVIFEDGTGRIIDLPGIMGLKNSVVTEKTKRVIFWIETNDAKAIRKTSMRLGIRTVAAAINEKNPDSEAAKMTFEKGIELYHKIARGKIISPLYDTDPKEKPKKIIKTDYKTFDRLIGIKLDRKKISEILGNLGFEIASSSSTPRNDVIASEAKQSLKVFVPSWREHDISIPEDLVEEVARIYGYNNIPSHLQPPAYVEQPKDMEDLFVFQNRIKTFLKHLGLNEVINYSMISLQLIEVFDLDPKKHLRLANSISEDVEYLRISLLPSIYKNIEENKGRKDVLRFFEIGKVYIPVGTGRDLSLPQEIYKLGIATNTDYFDLKGIVEALYRELNVGTIHELSLPKIIEQNDVFMTEIDLQTLIDNYHQVPKYRPINPYAVIKLDKTFVLSPQSTYAVIRERASQSKLLLKIEVVSVYENKLSLRFCYSSFSRNITEEEAKKELAKV